MYAVKTRTRRIDMDNPRDLEAYDEILNNPLCFVVSEKDEKISEREMSDEGRMLSIHERIVRIVTYNEKELL